ncbi:type I restriction endonuclease subunit R [Streptomyces naganishii]|uniref:type I site-specific deoxyribonuclease n=1 Tax=Streptomyces naganishii JCM 4654 TaxID=1306179 RepID=A0A918Y9L1_9ACTN|nr:type I restriction endonuclease [Streptomyces naganishii]GHD94826.1 type I restriction enzyme [Streptomyces naganishii JCM 4654]
MAEQPEYVQVERPLIEQLEAMGWEHLRGAPPGKPATRPEDSGRKSFTDVVYVDRFRNAVARINVRPEDGTSWLTAQQLDHVLARVRGTAPGQGAAGRGVTANLEVTRLLREGIPARTIPGWTKGDPEHIQLVDWDGRFEDGNDFLAVSQFRVERPGAAAATPDLVLFVNGLPWVVVECKAPVTSSRKHARFALDQAVMEAIAYAGTDAAAPVAEFTRFAQLLVGTDWTHAELGTVTAEAKHFAPWRTVTPAREAEVKAETGVPEDRELSAQQTLVAGVLRPAHLLTLIKDFTTETRHGSRTVKAVGRFQQFRAVHAIAATLRERHRALDAGEDVHQRGGVVWHTQGSGKSLTMAFLVRHLRSTKDLRGHKVVVVTDRIDLEKQIRRSLAAAEEKIYRSRTVEQARKYLAVDVPDVTLVMLQKARRDDTAWDGREEKLAETPDEQDVVQNHVANPGHDIVVLVDEAHRGHHAWQHARLRAMLPNAVLVGFTGTPILSKARKTTEDVFGGFTDTYTLRDAEIDRAVVPVRYEAHNVRLEVIEKAVLDASFDVEVPADPEQRERVLRKFARRKEVLETPSVIAVKAEHMLRHWARTALPDRFGAQVVTVSRKAAVRYRDALLAARTRLVEEIDELDPDLVHDPGGYETASPQERELLDLLPHRHLLRSIDAAVVISQASSGQTPDPEGWKTWTAKSRQDAYIARFKRGLGDPRAAADDPSWEATTHGRSVDAAYPAGPATSGDPWHADWPGARDDTARTGGDDGPIAFLVVQSMLLTGFDAPVEQVLYLDCPLSGVGLLQAVARTNRLYPYKEWGQIVDYIGVGPELARSLTEYDEAHLRAVYGYQDLSFDHLQPDYEGDQPVRDRMWLETEAAADDRLADLRTQITELLADRGIASLADQQQRDDLLAALADPLLLGEFDELVRDFLTALNAVLPRPAALKYETDARLLGETQYLARQRYLDGRDDFSPRRYGAKVRGLISRHLRVSGIEERIPSVELSAADFMERMDANPDPRTRTDYMRSRLRLHIDARLGADRTLHQRFSARLEEIVRQMGDDFEQAAAALAALRTDVLAAEDGDYVDAGDDRVHDLDRWTEQPVYGLLREAFEETGTPEGLDIVQGALDLTAEIARLVGSQDFVVLVDTQIRVRRELRVYLEKDLHMDWAWGGPLAGHLVELARERHADFLRYRRRTE